MVTTAEVQAFSKGQTAYHKCTSSPYLGIPELAAAFDRGYAYERNWVAFRAIHGPRPMGRGAQARWEAQWAKFQQEKAMPENDKRYPKQVAISAAYTYWEVAPGVFNVTGGMPPKGVAGYGTLEGIVKLKGDNYHALRFK